MVNYLVFKKVLPNLCSGSRCKMLKMMTSFAAVVMIKSKQMMKVDNIMAVKFQLSFLFVYSNKYLKNK